jgi:hypothetical protein
MKISELIEELKTELEKNGDCEVIMQREPDRFDYSPLAGVVGPFSWFPDNPTGNDLIDPDWRVTKVDEGFVSIQTETEEIQMKAEDWEGLKNENRSILLFPKN